MQQYDVSVVVPVYNCEKYIRKCVKSILDQDYTDLSRIQVILVDDGSIDNSLEVCNKLKEEINEFTIDIITGKNSGVSSARNKGVNAAKGKYILFIDADDYLSKKAIRKLVNFFERHYDEIDLVTYPIFEYDQSTNNKKMLQRYRDLGETKIYDLEKDYWAIQPTMNVMIKNYYENNVLFDENVYFHEDLLFNTEVITKKLKMGYVKEAKYYYRIYNNSATNYKENPLYSFEQFMYVAEKLFSSFETKNTTIPKYVQRIILNVIRYRIIKDKIFPYYLQEEDWDNAYNRFVDLVRKIDNDTIMQYNQMNKYHKMYLINLKNEKTTLHMGYDGSYAIQDKEERIITVEKNVEIVINRFKYKNGKVFILGFLKSLILKNMNVELYAEKIYNNQDIKTEKIELFDTAASRLGTAIKVSDFLGFEYEIKDVRELDKFKFKLLFNNNECKISYYFNTWCPFCREINSYKIYDKEYRIQYKNQEFLVTKPSKSTKNKDWKRAIKRYNKVDKKINIYRVLSKISKSRNEKIWLYYDRRNIFDNAYSQFKHDIKIKDDIKKYYILDGKIKNCREKFSRKELKNVIKFGSLKHKILFLNSDKVLTSFSSLQEYCPFYKKYKYYKDILKYDLIYLQHGILHANLLKMYAKIFTQIDKFVISSNFEKENLINKYEYKTEDLIEVGMPRLDENISTTECENKIIFAPSWRQYLIGETKNRKREINKEKFINSNYYIETIKFLKNEKMINTLKEKGIVLDFKLHPIFEPYKECFDEIVNDNIVVSIGDTDLNKYKAFITDFSSFQFDFVNLKRPITYFVPDMKEFKAGLHTYRELDLKHEDAFGKLCLTGDELVNELINLINNNFEMDDIYKQRMDNFFFKVDNRKDKLYEILKQD